MCEGTGKRTEPAECTKRLKGLGTSEVRRRGERRLRKLNFSSRRGHEKDRERSNPGVPEKEGELGKRKGGVSIRGCNSPPLRGGTGKRSNSLERDCT